MTGQKLYVYVLTRVVQDSFKRKRKFYLLYSCFNV